MIKKSSIRKISLTVFCLLIVLILYLFPTNKITKFNDEYIVVKPTNSVYLLDKNNHLTKVDISLRTNNLLDNIKELVSYLTINSNKKEIIPNNFYQVIPSNIKLLDVSVENSNAKLSFSSELLNITRDKELPIIESLLYTITSLNNIDSITIYINNSLLDRLPISKEYLPYPITRDFGINKEYNIESIKNINKTTLYYITKSDNINYYTPITKVSNNNKEKIEIIISELSSNFLYETNLISYLNSNTILEKYDIVNKEITLDFNNLILDDITSSNIIEEVTYAINMSIKDNYDLEKVIYRVNDKKIATFDIKNLE